MASGSKQNTSRASEHNSSAPGGDPPTYNDSSAAAAPPDYASRAGSIGSANPKRPLTEEERLTMLQAYAEERERANDNWGGHKGSAGQFEPTDPTRPFRRLSQIIRGGEKKGEEKISWLKPRHPDDGNRKWSIDGYEQEVAQGDQEGTRVA